MKMSKNPELNMEQESMLVSHLKEMATIRYGYIFQEVVDLSGDYAVNVQLKANDNLFTLRWFYSFIKRWPDQSVLKPRFLEKARTKGGGKANVDKYFDELSTVIKKYNLQDEPHLMYNVVEKGVLSTNPQMSWWYRLSLPAVTSGGSETVTSIVYGSASGASIPPSCVFSGRKMQIKWMDGFSPGSIGTVSDSEWSNSQYFFHYLRHHFLAFVPWI